MFGICGGFLLIISFAFLWISARVRTLT